MRAQEEGKRADYDPNKHTQNLTLSNSYRKSFNDAHTVKKIVEQGVSLWNCQSSGLKSRKPHDQLTMFREIF